MEQKFKRGNLVRKLVGHKIWTPEEGEIDISSQNVGRKAIIEYSYAEKYRNGQPEEVNSYRILWQDTGHSEAWSSDFELEFLEEGGEHLLVEAKKKREQIKKSDTDLNQIIETWVEKEGNLAGDTVEFLFDKIGYKSASEANGEYYILQQEWVNFYSFFNLIMTSSNVEDILNYGIKNRVPVSISKVIEFYIEVQSLKK